MLQKDCYTQSKLQASKKNEGGKSTQTCLTIPLHEALDDSVREHTTFRTELRELVDDRSLPDCYYHNHTVETYGAHDLVAPFGVFLDGVPYAHSDSILGIWGFNVVTSQRFLLAIIRGRRMCRCGCKSWCTIYELMEWLAWSFRACAEGLHPMCRHDQKPFGEPDRQQRAGERMQMRFCLLFVKGDWMEYSTSLGFPGFNDGMRCCTECNADLGTRSEVEGSTFDELRWRQNGDRDYY